jgi:acyl carrier protein
MLQQEQLSGLIREWVVKNRQASEPGGSDLSEEGDLLASGALDSMGFVQLLLYVESVTGNKVDLTDLDPNEFTSIRGLSKSLMSAWSKTA